MRCRKQYVFSFGVQMSGDRHWNFINMDLGSRRPGGGPVRADYVGHAPLRSNAKPWSLQWRPTAGTIRPSARGSVRGLKPRSFGLPYPLQVHRPAEQFRRKSKFDGESTGPPDLTTPPNTARLPVTAVSQNSYNKALIDKTTHLNERNFLVRVLYKDCY